MARNDVEARVCRVGEQVLAEQQYVRPVDVLLGLGWLAPSHLDRWRQGRVPYLAQVIQLSMAAGKAAGSASGMPAPSAPPDAVGVWPHVVQEPYQETDNTGRLKTKRHHYIELRNETGRPVLDVSNTLPDDLANLVMQATK